MIRDTASVHGNDVTILAKPSTSTTRMPSAKFESSSILTKRGKGRRPRRPLVLSPEKITQWKHETQEAMQMAEKILTDDTRTNKEMANHDDISALNSGGHSIVFACPNDEDTKTLQKEEKQMKTKNPMDPNAIRLTDYQIAPFDRSIRRLPSPIRMPAYARKDWKQCRGNFDPPGLAQLHFSPNASTLSNPTRDNDRQTLSSRESSLAHPVDYNSKHAYRFSTGNFTPNASIATLENDGKGEWSSKSARKTPKKKPPKKSPAQLTSATKPRLGSSLHFTSNQT